MSDRQHDDWLERVAATSPEPGTEPDAAAEDEVPEVNGPNADDLDVDNAVEADTAETVDPDNAPA
ncbi:hypothetical protein FLP10_04515 [Agromyces intestinalis]|uniref:Uncharacterized protein n=1 Tax=Agromyces intestinalis TaxID=2592652 RepID=A0A5C1YEA0_9MICO|nr:hypothetical protein [Agromyces intestinalis]QEO13765.1 hypothetical protein FLP10_04515 [Agromyces intestinalis]